jgi:hypothetical protein
MERLRIVQDIPPRFFSKDKAQAKAASVLSALVNLIGQQVSHFAILQNRTKLEQKLSEIFQDFELICVARVLTNLVSSEGGAYENAQKDLVMKITEFNQCLQDVDLKISIGELVGCIRLTCRNLHHGRGARSTDHQL